MTSHVKTKILLLFCCLLQLSCALYEDQVGKFDWRQQYVGKIKYLDFDQQLTSGRRMVVATEQNVLASLNIRTGDIGWRQLFEDGDTGKIGAFLLQGSNLIVVTGGGQYIRCFNPTLGTLNWEVVLEANSESKVAVLSTSSYQSEVIVLASNRLYVFDIDNGEQKMVKDLPQRDSVSWEMLTSQDETVTVIGFAANSHVAVVSYKHGGIQAYQNTLPAAWVSDKIRCSIIGRDYLVCVDGQTLQAASLSKSKVFKTSLFQDLGIVCGQASIGKWQDDLDTNEFPVFMDNTHSAVLAVNQDASIKLKKHFPEVSALQLSKFGDKQIIITLSKGKTDQLTVKSYDPDTGSETNDFSISANFAGHHGKPTEVYTLAFKKKDGSNSARLVVTSQDHSVVLIQPSAKVSWVREEALAGVLSVEMVDLPVSQIMAKMEDEFGTQDDIISMFLKRFKSQFDQIKELLIQLKNKLKTPRHQQHLVDEDLEEDSDIDDEDLLTRDDFNLNKMIVAVTAAGKLYGIYGPTGRIIWKQYLQDLAPFQRYGQEHIMLFVQRTTAHFPHIPQCVVLGKHKVTGQGLLFTFNPIGGNAVSDTPPGGIHLNYNILQAAMLPWMDSQFIHPVVLLDKALRYHVYPASAEPLVKEKARSFYMFTCDKGEGFLKGYSMTVSQNALVGSEIWSVNMLRDQQTITNIVSKRTQEHVHSQGIVLGDRNVLYKYINPNLVVITTEGQEQGQKGQSFLNIYLIDTVSGAIVFHCNHKKSRGPVHVVHSENWVVYNFWNEKQRRVEMGVLELYEGTKQSNATAFSSLSAAVNPLVMRQAYIFPGHLSTMQTTITEKGITNKHILFALQTGGLLQLPKMLVDARRPLELTPELREEGVMPYIPELPRPFEQIVNYNQSIYNIRAIHTAAAGLESTCLVFAYGLDLYFTRVNPSKMFDVLKEDFDYFFISSVLFGMIAVSIITQKLAVKKALNRAWR